VNFIVGGGGTGVPMVHYPRLLFRPCSFFALGSPIAMFLTVRGVDCLGEEFRLPTCPGFFNIFHPVLTSGLLSAFALMFVDLSYIILLLRPNVQNITIYRNIILSLS